MSAARGFDVAQRLLQPARNARAMRALPMSARSKQAEMPRYLDKFKNDQSAALKPPVFTDRLQHGLLALLFRWISVGLSGASAQSVRLDRVAADGERGGEGRPDETK